MQQFIRYRINAYIRSVEIRLAPHMHRAKRTSDEIRYPNFEHPQSNSSEIFANYGPEPVASIFSYFEDLGGKAEFSCTNACETYFKGKSIERLARILGSAKAVIDASTQRGGFTCIVARLASGSSPDYR